ncbi:hypothetical protein B0H10DRAFT_2030125 [Mycena sp. CBHHK59/15]|nr:hypothetical protein B0H10DRAFT_2030125 [Mycena sp. CBHHK59/15]
MDAAAQATKVAEQNRKLFAHLLKKLASDAPENYIGPANKLAGWLKNGKAYYAEARPQILNILLTARHTLCVSAGLRPDRPFHVSMCPAHQLTDTYTQLILAIEPYQHHFVEADYQGIIKGLVETVIPFQHPSTSTAQTTTPNPMAVSAIIDASRQMRPSSSSLSSALTFPPVRGGSQDQMPLPSISSRAPPEATTANKAPVLGPQSGSQVPLPSKSSHAPPEATAANKVSSGPPASVGSCIFFISCCEGSSSVVASSSTLKLKKKKRKQDLSKFLQIDVEVDFKQKKGFVEKPIEVAHVVPKVEHSSPHLSVATLDVSAGSSSVAGGASEGTPAAVSLPANHIPTALEPDIVDVKDPPPENDADVTMTTVDRSTETIQADRQDIEMVDVQLPDVVRATSIAVPDLESPSLPSSVQHTERQDSRPPSAEAVGLAVAPPAAFEEEINRVLRTLTVAPTTEITGPSTNIHDPVTTADSVISDGVDPVAVAQTLDAMPLVSSEDVDLPAAFEATVETLAALEAMHPISSEEIDPPTALEATLDTQTAPEAMLHVSPDDIVLPAALEVVVDTQAVPESMHCVSSEGGDHPVAPGAALETHAEVAASSTAPTGELVDTPMLTQTEPPLTEVSQQTEAGNTLDELALGNTDAFRAIIDVINKANQQRLLSLTGHRGELLTPPSTDEDLSKIHPVELITATTLTASSSTESASLALENSTPNVEYVVEEVPSTTTGIETVTIITHYRGLPSGTIIINFNINQKQLDCIMKWNERSKHSDDVRESLCLTLLCFSYDDVRARLNASGSKDIRTVLPDLECSWPKTGGLSMNSLWNGQRIDFPMSPPFALPLNGLLDVSPFMVLGENQFHLKHTRDMSDHLLVLCAHHPTVSQLASLTRSRQKERDWTGWLAQISEPLELPTRLPIEIAG